MHQNRKLRTSATVALSFAVALTIIETVHNWGDWRNPAFWIVDYLACAFLFWGAYLVLSKEHPAGAVVLIGGWGFTCGMFFMAYFLILAEAQTTAATDELRTVLNFAGALLAFSIFGFVVSLLAAFHKQSIDNARN